LEAFSSRDEKVRKRRANYAQKLIVDCEKCSKFEAELSSLLAVIL
jgi:hypothetical protein